MKDENVYLASLVVEDALSVFEHLLSPQVKEVIRVRVEFEPVLSIVPKKGKKISSEYFKYQFELRN